MLKIEGVDIAYVLAGSNWNNVGFNFHPSKKDIKQLASKDGRPLDSMLIVHNHPGRCLPPKNVIGIRSWYGRDTSPEENLDWLEKTWAEEEPEKLIVAKRLIDLSLRWPKVGSDDAMEQLKDVLDGLNGESIGDETLSKVIFSEPATPEKVKGKKQMVYFRQAGGSKRIRSSTGWRRL